MKKTANYSAWNVKIIDVENIKSPLEKLRYFSRFAVLAPSGHNTQPWLFHFDKDSVEITVNKTRQLPHSGKVAAEPYVSIGACVETLVQAARAFGYTLNETLKVSPEFSIKLSINGKQEADLKRASVIKNRVSNREFYEKTPIAKTTLDLLVAKTQPDLDLLAIKDEKDKIYAAEQSAIATINIMSDPAFRAELSQWVRNNVTRKHDGMPAFVQGMPTPPSLIAKHIIKNVDISKGQAKKDSDRLLNSGALILIGVKSVSDESFYQMGREYTRICLDAEAHGYATSGVGAGVIDTETKKNLQKHFSMTSLPSALIRIGKPTKKVHHSPRLPLEMVTI